MNTTVNKPLAERVAVVTGDSRGIGKAIALELAKRGAHIVVNYAASAAKAEEVAAEIQASGVQAAAVQADISDFDEAAQLIKTAIEKFGRIDILVNNAGMS